MDRRGFLKGLGGLAAGGLAALLGRKVGAEPAVTEPAKPATPTDFWDDPAEDIYTKDDGEPAGKPDEHLGPESFKMTGWQKKTIKDIFDSAKLPELEPFEPPPMTWTFESDVATDVYTTISTTSTANFNADLFYLSKDAVVTIRSTSC